jgi:hypothetical protein
LLLHCLQVRLPRRIWVGCTCGATLSIEVGFVAEARGNYRQTFDEELIGDSVMSNWSVGLNVGGGF